MYSFSQDDRMQSLAKLDIGILGTWVNFEYPISNRILFISEVGLNPVISGGLISGSGLHIAGRLKQEFRLYYNRSNRLIASKDIRNNSGNFLGLDLDYQPPNFFWSTNHAKSLIRQLRVFPKFGLRRVLSDRLIIEGHFGFGYGLDLNSDSISPHNLIFDLRVVVGGIFYRKKN